ncbi:uncharacterized protein [Diadema antillarum]|uniref:uncharacterized protein n=1 Tax=Diadema antillarum TaxID=105358 RepID=UPI003A854A32
MTAINQKEYLKRYLSGGENEVKKKKRRKKLKGTGNASGKPKTSRVMVVDDDFDIRKNKTDHNDDESMLDEMDEAPLVAEFVDERPEEEIKLEAYRSSGKWRTFADEDDNQASKGNDHRNTSVKGSKGHHNSSDAVVKQRRRRADSDSDLSPLRDSHTRSRKRHDSDSDVSPVRRQPVEDADVGARSKGCHDSDSDLSPQRTKGRASRGRHDSDSDMSPPRRGVHRSRRHDSDSDMSPPRPSKTKDSRGQRSRHDSDSDLSPVRSSRDGQPRRQDKVGSRGKSNASSRPPDSDSDLSPPRQKSGRGERGSSDSDLSPPRRSGQDGGSRRRMESDSDFSPERRGGKKHDNQSLKKPSKTLSGAKAGLSDAAALRRENEATRRRNEDAYNKLSDDVSGRNAETIFRDKSGKRRDLKAERRFKREEEEKQAEKDEKFMQWGKGLAQVKQQQDQVEDIVKEMAKPLARYQDDEDLDLMLKEQDREGDPMLAFLKKRESKARAKAGIKEKPKYQGPKPPPNRFNIQPGYRWDGVDRSSGFERKYFQRQADKKATSELAYKWSVEDM